MSNTDERIAELERRVDGLVNVLIRMTDILERRLPRAPEDPPNDRGDFAPIYPIDPTDLPGSAYAANRCPSCGITLEKMMEYACQHVRCPIGLGSTVCMDGR